VTDVIYCYYVFINKKKTLQKGIKPDNFPQNKAITMKKWRSHQRPKSKRMNPVSLGFQFVEYLEKHPDATYQDLGTENGINKARVCQMIALTKKLPTEIINCLLHEDKPEILKYFTERKLRQLTLMFSDNEKIKIFHEMKKHSESLHIINHDLHEKP